MIHVGTEQETPAPNASPNVCVYDVLQCTHVENKEEHEASSNDRSDPAVEPGASVQSRSSSGQDVPTSEARNDYGQQSPGR